MNTFSKLRLVTLFLVLGCTVGCDQTSKHIARTKLELVGSVTLPGGFGKFRLAENSGSFLSLGDSLPDSLRLALFTVVVGAGLAGLLIYLVYNTSLSWLRFFGLALVWAGGTSNLVDRVTQQGRVTDFIFLQVGHLHTGVFNAADFIIMLGITVLVCGLWRRRTPEAPDKRDARA